VFARASSEVRLLASRKKAKASSVGAKTVTLSVVLSSADPRPVAFTAATSTLKAGLLPAVSRIDGVWSA